MSNRPLYESRIVGTRTAPADGTAPSRQVPRVPPSRKQLISFWNGPAPPQGSDSTECHTASSVTCQKEEDGAGLPNTPVQAAGVDQPHEVVGWYTGLCSVRCVVYDAWCVVRGVWCMVCGVWCVACGVADGPAAQHESMPVGG